MKVRTRFAPSPTGYLHVGGIRTALFCWLLARQHDGQFILRLEDTDKKREVAGADRHLQDSLRSLDLDYDEGPDIGGPYGPYRQSERLDSYQKWAKKLVEAGRAYADPYSEVQLNKLRERAKNSKTPFLYRNHRPDNPPKWDGEMPLRFKSEPKAYMWHDEVMGDLSTGPAVVDDFILIKSDGYPTYNFSHIVDDAEMEITHIIRGQEFTASMPNYLNLYEALEIERPILATVPHILGPSGNKKLSKRDGAKDVLDYIRDGFLPDALINFIASLGWNDGTDQEIFSRQELIKKFALSKVQKSGARFDEKRLEWMNGHYIRELSLGDLAQRSEKFWPTLAKGIPEDYKEKVLSIIQERLKYMAELPELSQFFFTEPNAEQVLSLFKDPADKGLKNLSLDDVHGLLAQARQHLDTSDFSADDLNKKLSLMLEELATKPGILFAAIRVAVTGSGASPQLADTLSVLGKDKSLARLDQALAVLAKNA